MNAIHAHLGMRSRTREVADYSSVDIETLFPGLTRLGIGGLIVSGLLRFVLPSGLALLADIIFVVSLVLLLPQALAYLFFWYFGGRPRYLARQRLVDSINWRGDEWVLDVPTGSGFMLLACAQKLTTGKAIGVDLWLPGFGGGPEKRFLNNARIEGVADRVECKTMDAHKMMFNGRTFDVVISSFGVSHLGKSADERQQVVRDMLRVLKPGGTIALCDMSSSISESLQTLRNAGLTDIHQQGLVIRLLIARKPA